MRAKRSAGKRAALLAGLTAVGVVAIVALAYRERLLFQYHLIRLRLDSTYMMRALAGPPDAAGRRAVKEYVRRTYETLKPTPANPPPAVHYTPRSGFEGQVANLGSGVTRIPELLGFIANFQGRDLSISLADAGGPDSAFHVAEPVSALDFETARAILYDQGLLVFSVEDAQGEESLVVEPRR